MGHGIGTENRLRLMPNIPNLLTIIRILLTPLFVILLLKDLFGLALAIFTIAGVSDALDGFIARYYNQRTMLGAYLDPIADKILLSSAFIGLAVLKIIPGWLAVIAISREVLIFTGIAVFTITEKKYKVRPSIVSKCTTAVQISTIFVTLLNVNITGLITMREYLYWVTAGLTVISGFHYIYIGMNILQNNSRMSQE
jgi:cardiolipin synthase